MKAFKELASLCKASVSISVNDHKDYYQTVEQFISEEKTQDIDPEAFKEMIRLDYMVCVRAYPITPIGSYTIYHYDIDSAMEQMLEIVKKEVRPL